jgi:hypothetical protein
MIELIKSMSGLDIGMVIACALSIWFILGVLK